MDIYGYLWIFMDIYGYLWIFMDIYAMDIFPCPHYQGFMVHNYVYSWILIDVLMDRNTLYRYNLVVENHGY